jgi:ABC-type uncharacterized transport system involved in gliding motility auxiliary subunit
MEVNLMTVEQSETSDNGGTAKSRTSHKVGTLFGFVALIFLSLASANLLSNRQFTVFFWLFLVLGLGLLSAFVALRFQDVIGFLTSRQARYGANVAFSILGVVGIIVIINIVVIQRFDKAADWTEDKLHTLSDQTKTILQKLDKEVTALVFSGLSIDDDRAQQRYGRVKEMLEKYQRETNKLQVEFVDPIADPLKAQEYDIEYVTGVTVVFESGNTREQVTTIDSEQKFTSAVMKVVSDKLKKIYFLTGHGERLIEEFNQITGYSEAKAALEKQNYLIETLALTTQPQVPADCAALVIPGPKTLLATHEVKAISKYLNQNGKLLIMLDPLPSPEDPHTALIELMDSWGVMVGNDLVFDRIHPTFFLAGSRPEAPSVSEFEFHQISQHRILPVPFQLVRSVTPKTEVGNRLRVNSLAKTTDGIGNSWGETNGNFAELGYTEGEDTPPPVSLAVAVERLDNNTAADNQVQPDTPKETKTRIVVVGDSDFAANVFFTQTGGGDLFLNMINWLTLEEDLISIRPIDPSERNLRRTTASEAYFVQITSLFLVPLIVFIIGVFVWWRRR